MVEHVLEEINSVFKDIEEYLDSQLVEGKRYADVVKDIESIISSKANIAFPVNFSVNNIAAHDTAMENDTRVLQEGDVIKVDVGVEKEGMIIDSAKTYVIGNGHRDLIKACENALKEVVRSIKPGMRIKDVGEVVESVAEQYGYGVVSNLTGHSIEPYTIHGAYSIPNIRNNIEKEIKEGELIAVEPFFVNTSHNIVVKDMTRVEIFELIRQTPPRDRYARILYEEIVKKYPRLPFAYRWLGSLKGFVKRKSINVLVNQGVVHAYPVLYYPGDVVIVQAELTVLVKDKPRVFGFSY